MNLADELLTLTGRLYAAAAEPCVQPQIRGGDAARVAHDAVARQASAGERRDAYRLHRGQRPGHLGRWRLLLRARLFGQKRRGRQEDKCRAAPGSAGCSSG